MTTVRQNAHRADHVIFYPLPQAQVCCNVCGKTHSLSIPMPAKRVASIIATFVRRHADCKPGVPKKEHIHKHLFYITRPIPGHPKQHTVLLSQGGFRDVLDAETMIWIELEPGVKEYVRGMEGCRTHKGSMILAYPGRFEIEGGES